jgi:hypothetical protein
MLSTVQSAPPLTTTGATGYTPSEWVATASEAGNVGCDAGSGSATAALGNSGVNHRCRKSVSLARSSLELVRARYIRAGVRLDTVPRRNYALIETLFIKAEADSRSRPRLLRDNYFPRLGSFHARRRMGQGTYRRQTSEIQLPRTAGRRSIYHRAA